MDYDSHVALGQKTKVDALTGQKIQLSSCIKKGGRRKMVDEVDERVGRGRNDAKTN